MACNLIRCIISPNQDDLSYSTRTFFPGGRNWVSCQTHSLWLNNAAQRRHLTSGSSIAATAWTHEGTYQIYGFLVPISDLGIPVEYELDTFNTPPQEQLYVTPKIGYVDAMPLFRSRHLALISSLGHLNGDNTHLFTRCTKLMVTPKFISSNGNMAFAKLRRTQYPARPTIRTAFLITPFHLLTHYETCSTNTNYIFHAANKNYS